jgi:hypothetical protein
MTFVNAGSREIYILGEYTAYRIAHESPEEQREILKRDYRDILLKAAAQYTDSRYAGVAQMAGECAQLLAEKVKRKPRRKRWT